MRVVIDIEPQEKAPRNWRLEILRKLDEFMKLLDIKDYQIEINEINPYIIRWAKP